MQLKLHVGYCAQSLRRRPIVDVGSSQLELTLPNRNLPFNATKQRGNRALIATNKRPRNRRRKPVIGPTPACRIVKANRHAAQQIAGAHPRGTERESPKRSLRCKYYLFCRSTIRVVAKRQTHQQDRSQSHHRGSGLHGHLRH